MSAGCTCTPCVRIHEDHTCKKPGYEACFEISNMVEATKTVLVFFNLADFIIYLNWKNSYFGSRLSASTGERLQARETTIPNKEALNDTH